jgi:hypothetical protein
LLLLLLGWRSTLSKAQIIIALNRRPPRCQTFDTAMGHKFTKKEAVQMGLLKPDDQPSIAPNKPLAAPVAQLAARLAEPVDPFLHQSGG